MTAQSEIAIQTTLRNRARIVCPSVRLVAVPNGGKRTQWAANQARREGMSKGFPDLIAMAPHGKIAFLEMKSVKGRMAESQVEWQDDLLGMGFPCGVFRDADDALEFLRAEGFPFIDRVGRL